MKEQTQIKKGSLFGVQSTSENVHPGFRWAPSIGHQAMGTKQWAPSIQWAPSNDD